MLHLIEIGHPLDKIRSAFQNAFASVFGSEIYTKLETTWFHEDNYGKAGNHYEIELYYYLFKYFELYYTKSLYAQKTIAELNTLFDTETVRKAAACYGIDISKFYTIFNLEDNVTTDWMIQTGVAEDNFKVEAAEPNPVTRTNIDLTTLLNVDLTCHNVLTGCLSNCQPEIGIIQDITLLGSEDDQALLSEAEFVIQVGSRTITYNYG